jgi:choline dehydrogenase-like flavoprotein
MAQLVKVIQKTAIQLQNVGYTPSAALLALQTETDFENYVLANMSAVHHWHGQSLIGKVVDQNLNVIGVENLMVADVTLFPAADGNTQTMGYAAGCAAYTIITGDKKISF